jgi:hypothetical protein
VSGLGGQDSSGRRKAGWLLLAAGMTEEARSYLELLGDDLAKADVELLELYAQVHMARLRRRDASDAAETAWKCSLAVAGRESATDTQRRAARARAISLMPKVSPQDASRWVGDMFAHDPDLGERFVAEVAVRAEDAYASRDPSARTESLTTASIVGETLLQLPDEQRQACLLSLRLLALPWINESLKAAGEDKRLFFVYDDDEIPPLDESSLAKIAPSETWLAVLPVDAAVMARRLELQWAARTGDWEMLRTIAGKVAAYDVETARDAVDTYLNVTQQVDSPVSDEVDRWMYQYRGQGYTSAQLASIRQQLARQLIRDGESSDGISLTRAKQEKSLKDLRALLEKIDAAGLPSPSPKALLEAFGSAHSSAEVYRREDIEMVFGPFDTMPPATALPLVETMRENLAQQWRDLGLQESAGTQRSQSELTREVLRGYDLAIELCEAVLDREPKHIPLRTTVAMIYFDQSELLYGLGSDLPTYVAMRDRAFGLFQLAGSHYAESLAEREELSIDVYLHWFQVALGASDLTYLTRQHSADKPQIDRLAQAIASLPSPLAEEHLVLFGAALTDELDSIPPSLKPHCLRQALVVLGDHAAGDKARELLAYYQELLEEVHLHLKIDGPDVVGHGQPFGALLSVRYSGPLGREADHFAALLANYGDPSGDQIDNKEKLEEEIREKLSQGFDIAEIRFPKAAIPRGYGRPGWSETPLAYVVLSAKDPAIDTIPSLQVDLQFYDGYGSVLLPIVSQSLLIDARDKNPPSRPVANLAVKQLLDARQWDEGKLRLEIVAEAVGLIPELENVLRISKDSDGSGLRVDGIEDHGATVLELEVANDAIVPRCERTWVIDMSQNRDGAVSIVEEFAFPEVVNDDFVTTYEMYDDADVVASGRVVPLTAHYSLAGRRLTTYIIAEGAVVLGVGLLVVLLLRWRRPARKPLEYGQPSQLTPFSLLAFLRRVQSDDRLRLAERDRDILTGTILELEDGFFARGDQAKDASVLKEVFDDWHNRAQRQLVTSSRRR